MKNATRYVLGVFAMGVGLIAACSSSSSGGAGTGPGATGGSLCESSCAVVCTQDSDCNVGNGELCCNYGGSYGSACQQASACPVFCTSDSQCDTAKGQACCQTVLGNTQKVCADATACQVPCTSDSQCANVGGNGNGTGEQEQCFTALVEPVCVPQSEYLSECTSSSECKTQEGQTCCKTFSLTYGTSVIGADTGLCVTTETGFGGGSLVGACPVACTTDSECTNSSAGRICCNGACASACATTCHSDSDCTNASSGRICCGTPALGSPFWSSGDTVTGGGTGG